jgi:hypothetical protein
MPTTVFIWNNNMVSSIFGGGHKVVGHAAMHITSNWPVLGADAIYGDQTAEYVSWWPKNNATGPRLGEARKNLFMDMIGESNFAPDHVIRIANLDEAAMKAEWVTIRGKANAHYRLNVKNCSTIVGRVLRAGKSWTSTNIYYAHSPLWTPLKAKRLAFSMGGTEMAWPALLAEMFDKGAISAGLHVTYGKGTKRSTRHGNPDMPAKHKTDAPHGLARWYK